MASLLNFKEVFSSGISFLKVLALIFLLSSFNASIGLNSLQEYYDDNHNLDLILGILFILMSILVLLSGIIGSIQKLSSDAFLLGFKSAKTKNTSGDKSRMNVADTLQAGFRVLGIVFLTLIISLLLFYIGFDVLINDNGYGQDSYNFTGVIFIGLGFAVMLAILFGLFVVFIAEGVSTGAAGAGVSFARARDPKSGSILIEDLPNSKNKLELFLIDIPRNKRLLLYSSAVLFIGLISSWETEPEWYYYEGIEGYSLNGFDFLFMFGGLFELQLAEGLTILNSFELLNQIQQTHDGDSYKIALLNRIILNFLPMLCIVTFSFAWIGSTRLPNNKYQYLLNLAGWIHVSIFLLYIVLSYYVALEQNGEIDFERQLIEKIGIYISALAGLGLIRKPWSFLPLLEIGSEEDSDETSSNDYDIELLRNDMSIKEAASRELYQKMKNTKLIFYILLGTFFGTIWYYILVF